MKLATVVAWLGILGLISGCSSSQLASPASSPPTESPARPASPSFTASPAPTPTPRPTPAPTATATATAAATVGLAPEGRWTAIQWIDAGRTFPQMSKARSQMASLNLYGWSGGYVAFESDGDRSSDSPRPASLASTSSTDGLHWFAPRPIDISGFPDRIDIAQVVEGPAGLIAVGRFTPDTCGGPPVVAGLWHSTDGATWRAIPLPRNMIRGHVETLDGGSAGYIAAGKQVDQKTAGIWVSHNATAWHAAVLPKPASGTLVVNGATSFAGGLVVAGAVIGPEGCGGASSIHPAVWWSADGSSWAREALPGASATADASLSIRRLNDDTIVAISQAGDTPNAWISTDGRTWNPVETPSIEALFGTVTDLHRSIVVATPDGEGPLTFKAVDNQLKVATLVQTGDGPVQTADSIATITAVGPTGIVVVTVDGSHLWLGVPSAS
jgi:hypothetical protein